MESPGFAVCETLLPQLIAACPVPIGHKPKPQVAIEKPSRHFLLVEDFNLQGTPLPKRANEDDSLGDWVSGPDTHGKVQLCRACPQLLDPATDLRGYAPWQLHPKTRL